MKQRILVIDDEQTIRHLLGELLRYAGYEVHSAANGAEGLRMARELLPDLILCDVNMPVLSGFDCLAAVRQEAALAVTPFVFLTGRGDHVDIRQGMTSGADDYIVKPFNAHELLKAVAARLARQSEIARVSERKLDDLRGNIVHMLPHELRTPLQGILGFADLLLEDYQTMERDQIGEMAGRILTAAQRLHRVVENFLVHAQIQVLLRDAGMLERTRQQTMSLEPGTIEQSMNGNDRWQPRLGDTTIEVEPALIRCSLADFRKIFEELFDNACKFSAAGTPIGLIGRTRDRTYVFSVKDQGRGMSPEQIQSIGAYQQFDRRFYEQQGTGLGLVIARGLAEVHRASLTIDSKPDAHTCVELCFQLADV